jgi:sporulation protein YhbH
VGFQIFRMERDRARFREIVRGKLREDLRKYLSTSELLGRQGKHAISIPIPQIELPRFRFGDNKGRGVGQGPGKKGEPLEGSPQEGDGQGAAGDQEGRHILEVEVDLAELAEMLGEELELPNIEPRGSCQIHADGGRYTGVRAAGPQSLRHFRRTYKRALKRTIAVGTWDPERPRVIPIREDERFRARKTAPKPEASAVIFHMMDVSGSMGREQKDIVRIKAFWIDTWLRSQYQNIEVVYIVHDAVAKIVDQESFFHLRESGGTKISSAYELCLKLVQERYRPERWNIYPFHYSDGDNWSARDTERCVSILRDEVLGRVNQFCYGQVKSAYGSGQFKKDLDAAMGEDERLVTSNINSREEIPDSIRAFLGKGR